jgi:polyhydroxyalkanoate synthesis regulator protein
MAEARIVKFHRHRYARRAVLYDDELDLRSIEDLRAWAAHGVDFVIIDSETGEDVTRVLLA